VGEDDCKSGCTPSEHVEQKHSTRRTSQPELEKSREKDTPSGYNTASDHIRALHQLVQLVRRASSTHRNALPYLARFIYNHNGARRPLRHRRRLCRYSTRKVLLARPPAQHLDHCHARDRRHDPGRERTIHADTRAHGLRSTMVCHLSPFTTKNT
jgi:hypothetical protein